MPEFDPDQPLPPFPQKAPWERCYPDLPTAVSFAAHHFRSPSHITFVIAESPTPGKWFVFPLAKRSHFDSLPPRDRPRIVFCGTYADLTALARAFPPDLFLLHNPHVDTAP